ncbi:MAG: SAM-dependent methyltransferase [Tannerellaceae bacterium]|jgi:hypothetical protein|nr:SAM-dependent methyltransferase [Tannerellaceae bacterium]
MSTNFFYEELGYERLVKCSDIPISNPEYQELEKIGADKVYFSGDFPAILFKEVIAFDAHALREITEIQHKAWNYRKVMFLFAASDTEIRIYNCYEKPKYIKPDADFNLELKPYEIFESKKTDKVNLEILVELFSRAGIDCGLIWTSDYGIREKVNIQRRIDRFLVQSLVNTAELLNKDIQNKEIIHGLLMRSLFILYLEDKGAAQEAGLYEKIKKGANCYFDILEDTDATYRLFAELQIHFNGNVFPVVKNEQQFVTERHLKKIKACFMDGDISDNHNPALFEWRIFNFNFIQIELLSEIYENFLGELTSQKEKGQFYTPYPLVELMLNDKLPTTKDKKEYNVKIIDPACGSGIFLVEGYKRLIRRWKNAHPDKNISFTDLKDILINNIYGIEIDSLAIKVAAFSLYLTLVEQLDPKTLWIKKEYTLPYLINNTKDDSIANKQGNNLWCNDTIGEIETDKFVKANLLIGNPPFGTEKIDLPIKKYLDNRKYAQEKVLAFLDKAIRFINDDGEIALIFNTKVLTNTNKKYQNFRKWLFKETHVEKIYNLSIFRKTKKDFGGQLFNSAVVPISIVYYRKNGSKNISDTIEYCAPKTYVKSNVIDGLVIDSTDVKHLPRSECQKPDTKIWKIGMWGNLHDFNLIMNLNNSQLSVDLSTYFKQNNWIFGAGLNGDSEHKDFVPTPIIITKAINRYYTSDNFTTSNNDCYRKINESLFVPPFVILKKGQKDRQVTASYIDHKAYCKSAAFIINKDDKNFDDMKKALVAFFNSNLATYYLFLSTSSWGIEREQIFFKEYLELPSFFLSSQNLKAIISLFDELISELKKDFPNGHFIEQTEKAINIELYNVIGLTKKEQILIQDTLSFSLDLFEQGENSIGFKRTLYDENEAYADMLCNELNDFLQHSSLKANATIFDVQLTNPLNLVIVSFESEQKTVACKSAKELTPALNRLNEFSLQEKGKSIYVRKQYRYYDTNKIYLIKPNQKRFWTRSQAVDDALSLTVEIANMEGTI